MEVVATRRYSGPSTLPWMRVSGWGHRQRKIHQRLQHSCRGGCDPLLLDDPDRTLMEGLGTVGFIMQITSLSCAAQTNGGRTTLHVAWPAPWNAAFLKDVEYEVLVQELFTAFVTKGRIIPIMDHAHGLIPPR